jgi:digeranylgeranylglycerophospholipid reductase
MQCDLLIIGAGPAGSAAAITASCEKINVIVVEKRVSIGEPIECAEFVPRLLRQEIDFSKNCVVQEIKTIKLFNKDGLLSEFLSPGYMLNRATFDKELATEAIRNGARYLINARCVGFESGDVIIQQGRSFVSIRPKVIIGADGPKSTVGKWMKKSNTDFVMGLQVELPLLEPQDYLEICFLKSLRGGYGWLFPKGGVANVGIGVSYEGKDTGEIRNILNQFCNYLEEIGKVKNIPISKRAGLIPCSGLFPESVFENMMLVGDAAGQTHPITGGGIAPAVICGKIAGNIAAKAIKKEDLNILKEYDIQYRKVYEKEMTRAVLKRKWMNQNWENLDDMIPYFWPTFKEYYE